MARKQRYSQKKILIIASYIFLAVAGVWYLFTTGNRQQASYFTPTGMQQAPTNIEQITPATNWKTYTNNKYGYTVMYPPNFSAQDASPNYS